MNKLTKEELMKIFSEGKNLTGKPIYIDFYADWWGPCRMFKQVLEEVIPEYKDKIDFYKVDIDKELDIAVAFNVMSVPNLLFIPMKSEAKLLPGAPSESQLEELINEYLINED